MHLPLLAEYIHAEPQLNICMLQITEQSNAF